MKTFKNKMLISLFIVVMLVYTTTIINAKETIGQNSNISNGLKDISSERGIPATTTIISYLDTGYKFKVVSWGDGYGFEQPNFDDSEFSIGNAGFGTLYEGCSLNNPMDVQTLWTLNTDILLRKLFYLPSGSKNLKVFVAIDNEIQVFINGIDVSGGLKNGGGCPVRDFFIFNVPDSILRTGDTNLIAIRGRDVGVASYVDVKVTADSVTILSPNGGENWQAGINKRIRWSYTGNPGPYVKIELLKGEVLNSVITSNTPINTGYYDWLIPIFQPTGSDYKARITSISNSVYTDMSDNNFIISPPSSITVLSPNGGENWPRGSTKIISWSSVGSPGANVKIELLKGGILNSAISSSTPNDGSYSWTIPSTQTLGNDYKIRVTSTSNSAYTDTSNNNFIISSPTSITVTYPNGGEKLVRGTTKAVRWSYSGSPGPNIKIELLKGGILNHVISPSAPIGLGYYNWAIPSTQTLGSDYKIKITSTSNPAYTDMSNNNFIVSNPYITVGPPNGGENWARGTTHTISWTSVGSTGSNVKIELFKSGVLNRAISSSTPNDGSYSWVVPSTQTLGTDYKIKITSTSNSVYNDWSNSNFRIS